MTESPDDRPGSGRSSPRAGGGQQGEAQSPRDSWERRAEMLASEMQRWLIKTGAKSVRDEFSGQVRGQVRRAFRGSDSKQGDAWSTATNEPPQAADEAPECAWCPVCRAARRISQARSGGNGRSGPILSDAADVVAAAIRDALAGIDAIMSYRPGGPGPEPGQSAAAEQREQTEQPPAAALEPPQAELADSGDDQAKEPDDEPGDRG